MENRFYLAKWFLDCITEDGEALIGYSAILKWSGITIPYSSLLVFSPGEGSRLFTSFKAQRDPVRENNIISWTNNDLEIKGEWVADALPLKEVLHQNREGDVIWNCYQPKSKCKIKWKEKEYSGFGYTEKLELTKSPWSLNMKILRWGRYTSSTNSMVWIQILGSQDSQWIWYNGIKAGTGIISDREIELPASALKLKLDPQGIIESEKKIYKTVKGILKFIPGIEKVIPKGFLNANETKWCSRGILFINNIKQSKGWVIHEKVEFT